MFTRQMKPLRSLGQVWLLGLSLAGLAFAQVASQTLPSVEKSDLGSLDLESLLNTEVITASKFSENLADAPGIISVISQDELRRFGGITLQEVLERVPGLALTTSYFTDRSMVAARGDQTKYNGSHVLFLINGRPIREVMEGGLISDLLEAFPINALEKIEIIKGPGSVLYGSNAFSAVINLITRKAEHNGLALSGFGGENGVKGGSGQVMIQRGDFNLFGAGQFHKKPNWNTSARSLRQNVPTTASGRFSNHPAGAGNWMAGSVRLNSPSSILKTSMRNLSCRTFTNRTQTWSWRAGRVPATSLPSKRSCAAIARASSALRASSFISAVSSKKRPRRFS